MIIGWFILVSGADNPIRPTPAKIRKPPVGKSRPQVARVLARFATYGAFERSPYRNSRITHAMTPWNQDPQGAFLRCHSSSHALGSVRVLISMRPCHPSRDPSPRRARRAPRARDFATRVCETIAAMRAHATQGGTAHVGHSAIVSTPSYACHGSHTRNGYVTTMRGVSPFVDNLLQAKVFRSSK